MIQNEANASENPESSTAPARTDVPPQNAPTVPDQSRTALAEPISRIVENITAPLQQMMRRIAEMIRPSWFRAIQNLVRNPMLDALRRIRGRMETFIGPAHNFLRRIGESVTGSTSPLMRVFQQVRDWASGFMTYGAKLRRLTDAMFSSWSWKLPDVSAIFKPIVDSILTMLRGIQWPSLTLTIVELATRLVFWAAVKARDAVVNDENSEEVVKEFMLSVLDVFPSGEPHVEAAKEALLEDAWLRADPHELTKVLRKRIRDLHRNHRLIGTTELGRHHIVSLETPSARPVSDGGKLLTLGESLADPFTVEDLVLGSPEYRDGRIGRVIGQLTFEQARVADLWARDDGMTWEKAAAEAGLPPEFGERVRRKLRRLGKEFVRRQPSGLHTPSPTGPRIRPAFC